MAWVAVMKSGNIITTYCSCIAGYAILFGAMDCVSMYECYVRMYMVYVNVALCVYLCTYIVRMNVAMYVCTSSDMLKAQPDGTKVFKHPHEYYCQVQSGIKNTMILYVGLARRSPSHESNMTRCFVKNL